MTKFRKIFLLISINTVVVVALLELGCRTLIFFGIISWKPQIYQTLSPEVFGHLPIASHLKDSNNSGKFPHPYFAYKDPKSTFEKAEIYFRKRNAQTLTIGIFGGSVAKSVFDQNGDTREIEIDTKNFNLSVLKKEKNVVVGIIGFARGGGKQPESLIMSSIYGETLDLAVNIEGVNEMTSFYANRFPPYFPLETVSNFYFSSLERLKFVPITVELLKFRDYLRKSLQREDHWLLSLKLLKISVYNVINQILYKIQTQLNKEIQHDFYSHQKALMEYSPKVQIRNWLRFSCLQQNVLLSQGTRSIFFVQPIPFFLKELTPKEQSYFANNDQDTNIQAGLKRFLEQNDISITSKSGFNVINLLPLFKNEKDTVYVDSCCHLNTKGRRQLIAALLTPIQKTLSSQPQFCDLDKLHRIVDSFIDP